MPSSSTSFCHGRPFTTKSYLSFVNGLMSVLAEKQIDHCSISMPVINGSIRRKLR